MFPDEASSLSQRLQVVTSSCLLNAGTGADGMQAGHYVCQRMHGMA